MKNLEDVYLAVFYPAAMNKPNDWVIGVAPSAVYTQNKGFDAMNKGYITRGDVTAKLRSLYQKAGGRIPLRVPVLVQTVAGVSVATILIAWLANRQFKALARDISRLNPIT